MKKEMHHAFEKLNCKKIHLNVIQAKNWNTRIRQQHINVKQEYTYLEQVVEISILECFVRAFQTPLES